MTDPDPSLDLRITPDWLKESGPTNRYADYEGDEAEGRYDRARRDRRDDRRPRRPSDRDRNQPRKVSGQDRTRPVGPQRTDRNQPRTAERAPRPQQGRFVRRDEPRPEVEPAPVQIDFLPEERAFSKIIQQIKSGHVAYPLFGLARMFLERPERHAIRVRSLDNHTMIYQLGDRGAVAMEASSLERIAFNETKEQYYETQILEKEPIKGNFTSVARCTLSGKLLGPTNYHAFQPLLRALYEQRFSRRMTFEEYRRTIEITSDSQAVEQWKEEARKVVTYRTKNEPEPTVFENLAAVEQHFRTHYLATVVRPCLAGELPGDLIRHLPDRNIIAAVRKARDRENRFPAQMAGALRHGLNQAGLHVFRHKKRILYISTARPQVFDPNQASVSPSLSAILSTIRSYPRIARKQLAEKVLSKLLGQKPIEETSEEYQHARTSLATDLIWLAKAGHIIEFADGTLDLPLPPKPVVKPTAETAEQPTGVTNAGSEVSDTSEPAEDLEIAEPENVAVTVATEPEPVSVEVAEASPVAEPQAVATEVAETPAVVEPRVGQ
jgi:hypothetical protein